VTEVDVRAMLERASAFEPSVVEGRFTIHVVRDSRPWIVIVEPDDDASLSPSDVPERQAVFRVPGTWRLTNRRGKPLTSPRRLAYCCATRSTPASWTCPSTVSVANAATSNR
jgi:hypothetical protein